MLEVMSIKQRLNADVEWRRELKRFIRFGVVGSTSTLIDFSVLTGLKFFFGWPTLPANLISYSCGMLDSYLLTRHWVYPESRAHRSHVQLFRFIFINMVGLLLNMILLLGFEVVFNALLNNASYSYIPAKIAATALVFLWNFFANRLWAFNPNAKPKTMIKPAQLKGKEAEVYEQSAA